MNLDDLTGYPRVGAALVHRYDHLFGEYLELHDKMSAEFHLATGRKWSTDAGSPESNSIRLKGTKEQSDAMQRVLNYTSGLVGRGMYDPLVWKKFSEIDKLKLLVQTMRNLVVEINKLPQPVQNLLNKR